MNKNIYTENEVRTLDIPGLIFSYLRKWWLILVCVILGIAVAFLYTKNFKTPLYQAGVTMYVNNVRSDAQIDSVSTSNLTAAQSLVNTYLQIIQSNSIFEKVIERNHWEDSVSVAKLKSMVSASQVNNTEIFNLYVSSPYPEVAFDVANSLADVVTETMSDIVEGSSVKIIDRAKLPTRPYAPSYVGNMFKGGAIAGVVILLILTIQFLMDAKIREAEDLEQMFDLPVIGQIPNFEDVAKLHSYSENHNKHYSTY